MTHERQYTGNAVQVLYENSAISAESGPKAHVSFRKLLHEAL
jgi:hypothetical protein